MVSRDYYLLDISNIFDPLAIFSWALYGNGLEAEEFSVWVEEFFKR